MIKRSLLIIMFVVTVSGCSSIPSMDETGEILDATIGIPVYGTIVGNDGRGEQRPPGKYVFLKKEGYTLEVNCSSFTRNNPSDKVLRNYGHNPPDARSKIAKSCRK